MDSDLGRQLNLYGTFLEMLGVMLSLAQLVLYDVRTSDPTRAGRWLESNVRKLGVRIRDHRAIAAVGVLLILAAFTGSDLDDAVFGDEPSVAMRVAGSVVGYAIGFLAIAYVVPQLAVALEYLGDNLRASLTTTAVLFGVGVFMEFYAVWQYG